MFSDMHRSELAFLMTLGLQSLSSIWYYRRVTLKNRYLQIDTKCIQSSRWAGLYALAAAIAWGDLCFDG